MGQYKREQIKRLFLFICLVLFCSIPTKSSGHSLSEGTGKVYYVSPSGSDKNEGTYNKPWRSFFKAASTLVGGDTAYFLPGQYNETRAIKFKNDGLKERPIVFKSLEKHGARIVFSSNLSTYAKIQVRGKRGIHIVNFEITQEKKTQRNNPRRTSDIMIICSENSENIVIAGNKLHSCYEDGIKVASSKNIIVNDNYIYNIENEGIDALNAQSLIVDKNIIEEIGRVGIMIKGGSSDVLLSRNIVRNTKKYMKGHGITLGGSTFKSPNSRFLNSRFEGDRIYVWKNVVIALGEGEINNGISFIGANESYVLNNVILGTKSGISFYSPGGIKNGWSWNPITTNPVIHNNIFSNIEENVYKTKQQPKNLERDFNLYYKSRNSTNEPNSIHDDPLFEDPESNWILREASPAIGSAKIVTIPEWIKKIVSENYKVDIPLLESTNLGVH